MDLLSTLILMNPKNNSRKLLMVVDGSPKPKFGVARFPKYKFAIEGSTDLIAGMQ
jgi:hypothetical protein